MHTWAKCFACICIVLLQQTASAIDLCTGEFNASALNSSWQRNVILDGGIPSSELVDPLSLTPLTCATSCCTQSACNAVFFFNETCFLIGCQVNASSSCTSSPSDLYADSYWLLVRDPTEAGADTEKPSALSVSAMTSSSYTVVPSSSPPVLPTSELGRGCNNSECGANEECAIMVIDAAVTSFCKCLAGFHLDELTKTCVKDMLSSIATTESPRPMADVPSSSPLSTTHSSTPTMVPVQSLTVSAGEERVIRWPKTEVTVNAFVIPLPNNSNKDSYRYQWSLLAHPAGTETGEMVDLNSASLKLSRLRIGTYTFKVTVSTDGNYGESYVNVTVLPPERDNEGPVAIVKPNAQEITQPNDLIIDGSASTDDDKIIRYHWEQVSGPLDSLANIDASDLDKPMLVLKGLGPGTYRFKLTVTDSNNVQNDTYADAIVKKETDYPPKANAGSNVIISLPQNSLTLYGNASQDDKEIISYEWTKKSDDRLTADMMGVRTPFLQLANLQVGDYTFSLTVTDSANQKSSADVHVFVKPEHNLPPVSRPGPDRVVWLPIESLTLDGSNSTDDQKIVSYLWSLLSGPNVPVIGNSDQAVATVTKLVVGDYKFQLLVKDNEDLEATSQILVTVKENPNRAPVANAGGDRIVYLPAPLIVINGSGSSDDKGIVSYLWVRDKNSPAAGEAVLFTGPLLQLVNVVPGRYKFSLKVTDAEGLEGLDTMALTVEQDPYRPYLVELYLSVRILSFTEINQLTLKEQLSLLLRKSSSSGDVKVVIRSVSEEVSTGRTLVVFYVDSVDKGQHRPWPAMEVVKGLKKLRYSLDILDFEFAKFEPSVCQNNCSGHGVCDQMTKMCICDGFWMEDFVNAYFGAQETNCDWSILYVVIIVFFGVVIFGASVWALICYCKRCRCSYLKPKLKQRHRYSGIESQSDDSFKSNENMELIPKDNSALASKWNKGRSAQKSSLMQSDSEFSSDEALFVNSKRPVNGIAKKMNNGSTVSDAKLSASA